MVKQFLRLKNRLYLMGLIAIIGCLLIPLGLHAYNGTFSRYIADDFCTASILNQEGLIQSQVYWYTEWSGRFAFTFTVTLIELIGPIVVPILPALTIMVWIAITSWALKPTLAKSLNTKPIYSMLAFSILIVFTTIDQAPDVIQSLYWQTGAITYIFPLLFLTLYYGLIQHIGDERKSKKELVPWIAGSILLSFISGGFSEISAILQVCVILIALVIIYLLFPNRFSTEKRIVLFSGLLGSFLSLAVVILAPGNMIRRSLFAEPLPFFDIARTALDFGWDFFHKTLTRIYMTTYLSIIFPALFILTFWKKPDHPPSAKSGGIGKPILFFLLAPIIALFLIVCCMVPSIYGTGGYPPDRALIISQFVLSLFTITWGILLGILLKRFPFHQYLYDRIFGFVLFTLLLALMLPSPFFSFRRNSILITPVMQEYAGLWDSRDAMINDAIQQGNSNLKVIPLPHLSGLPAIGEKPDEWLNVCVARFYLLDSIVASDVR